MKSGIYSFTNTVTGRAYIGRGKDLSNRRSHHYCQLRHGRHANPLLQADYDKYGADAFEFTVIEYAPLERLASLEQQYIRATANRYNKTDNPFGGSGPHTDETKRRMSGSHTGRKASVTHRQRISEANSGENNHSFRGYYHTPWGTFPSSHAAADAEGALVYQSSILRFCQPDKVVTPQGYGQSDYLKSFGKSVIGKTYRELGYWFEPVQK